VPAWEVTGSAPTRPLTWHDARVAHVHPSPLGVKGVRPRAGSCARHPADAHAVAVARCHGRGVEAIGGPAALREAVRGAFARRVQPFVAAAKDNNVRGLDPVAGVGHQRQQYSAGCERVRAAGAVRPGWRGHQGGPVRLKQALASCQIEEAAVASVREQEHVTLQEWGG
jgi:hypothetical protein